MIVKATIDKLIIRAEDPRPEDTVKSYLQREYHFSRRLLIQLKEGDRIQKNRTVVYLDEPVKQEDEISIHWPDETAEYINPEAMELDIRYEDEQLMVINKPAGLTVHPTMGYWEHTLANGVMHYWHQHRIDRKFRPVNRLDRNTSGLVMVAKNPWIHQRLSNFPSDLWVKKYIAIVHGSWEHESSGTIRLPIATKKDSIIEREVRDDGKEAVTHWELIGRTECYSMLRLTLETGRTHQIRVHLSHIGHPLAGDDLYGGRLDEISRHALHAEQMIFYHPINDEMIKVESALPTDMKEMWERAGSK